MSGGLREVGGFVLGRYRERLAVTRAGLLHRDPVAELQMRSGRNNPYPVYERMRAAGPVVRSRTGVWAITSHEGCVTALRDRRFGNNPIEGHNFSFLDMNPPDHTRLRRVVQPAFSPRHLAGHQVLVEEAIGRLVERSAARGEFDLIAAVANPLPIAVITRLLGVPDTYATGFNRIGTIIAGALDGVRSLRHAMQLTRAHTELTTLFGELFELRRREPGDDVISRVVAAEADQVRPGEMVPLCVLLLVAGFETVVNLIGNAVNALLDHPEQWAALCADPATMAPRAVAEVLRFDPPVQRTVRMVLEDVRLQGRDLRRGEFVMPLFAAANRDPSVHPNPGRFDIHRDPSADNLAFSAGIHYCVGQPLALLEGAVALRTLAERMPDLARAGRTVRRRSTLIRGLTRLPVSTRIPTPARSLP